jgi:uncharacterized DUF497 family protein
MEGFQWDDENVNHIARHDVTPEEVEYVMCGDAVELDVQYEGGEPRFPLLGETAHGRILLVVYTVRDGLLRPVTAYQPASYLRRHYFEQKGARG